MEDWQNSSLEEKVDLDNLVLFPPDLYPDTERREFGKDIKEEQSEENSDIIENPAYNNIKTEIDELIEPDNDTRSFEFSINGAEICQLCGLEFGNKAVLRIHNSLVHPEEKKENQNVDLERKDEVDHKHEAPKIDRLKKHIKLGHEGIKQFKCIICDYETARNHNLKKHIESVHEGIKPFKCIICDYEFTKNSSLKKHIESVHEGIKPFKCKNCDYKTASKANLKIHTKSVHEGIKQFKCTICDYETAQRFNLKAHIESVHEGIKSFKCNICDYEFTQNSNLKKTHRNCS